MGGEFRISRKFACRRHDGCARLEFGTSCGSSNQI
jgi:hypothetical protein